MFPVLNAVIKDFTDSTSHSIVPVAQQLILFSLSFINVFACPKEFSVAVVFPVFYKSGLHPLGRNVRHLTELDREKSVNGKSF